MRWLFAAIAVVIFILFLRRAIPELRRAFGEAVRDAKAEVDAHRAANDGGEPIDDKEVDEIIAWYYQQARPALMLRPDPEADAAAAAARLGGNVWFADGEEWPIGPDGEKLEFVAQYDLARLPQLDGFPRQGVARFFVGRDDLFGANFDVPDRSNVRVLWHDGPQSGGRHEAAAKFGQDDYSPFQDTTVVEEGLSLRPELVDDLPEFYSWQLQERIDPEAGRPGYQELENRIFEISETREFAHRIGGHPSFTQYDFRTPGKYDDLDIVLLGLSSDKAIMWGDVGEAAFYIRRADLERRDFSRVAFYWDCH